VPDLLGRSWLLGDQRLRTPEGIDVLPIGNFLQRVENDQLFD